jgi:hypothetical protein
VKWKRLHVQEQKTNMEDIQIINPDVAKEGKEKCHVCKLKEGLCVNQQLQSLT